MKRDIFHMLLIGTSTAFGIYCTVAGFMHWPLTNLVWFGSANGFCAFADFVSRNREQDAPIRKAS